MQRELLLGSQGGGMRSLVAGLLSHYIALVVMILLHPGRAAAEEEGEGGGKAASKTGGVRKASK